MLKLLLLSVCLMLVDCSINTGYLNIALGDIKNKYNVKLRQTNIEIVLLRAQVESAVRYSEDKWKKEVEKLQIPNCLNESIKPNTVNFKECYLKEQIAALEDIRYQLTILNKLTCEFEEICENLNPLPIQIRSLKFCIFHKLIDFDRQFLRIETDFKSAVADILTAHQNCLGNQISGIFSRVSQVKLFSLLCK